MNRHDPQIVHTNRPTSRRLHRRIAPSTAPSCMDSNLLTATPRNPFGLTDPLTQAGGLFDLLAAELRIAELEKALAEARQASFTDPLTGALNRRGFEKACQREIARSSRSGSGFALAHIDLDDFKDINDTFGHPAGDKALVHLVSLLHKKMRPSDVLCRTGGEEFVLMLPETSLDDATAVISRFLDEFSSQKPPEIDCLMTFSAGVVLRKAGESLEEAIQRADAATYAAKRAGKNCVVSC